MASTREGKDEAKTEAKDKDEAKTSAHSDDRSPLIFFLGGNGSGKSSLINVLTGETKIYVKPTQDFSLRKLIFENSITKAQESVTLVDTPPLTPESTLQFDKFIGQVKSRSIAACVFVKAAGRVFQTDVEAYRITRLAADRFQVPLIMALSQIDFEPDMHAWWRENGSGVCSNFGWKFDAVVPVSGISDPDLVKIRDDAQTMYIKNRQQGRQFIMDTFISTALLGAKAKPIPIEEYSIFPLFIPKVTVPCPIFNMDKNQNRCVLM